MVLARIKFHKPIYACCGLTRKDLIYEIGKSVDFKQFQKDAKNLIVYYGRYDQKIYKSDVHYLEYYEAPVKQDWRGTEESLFEFFRSENDIWHFKEKGVTKFSVRTIEELNDKWKGE